MFGLVSSNQNAGLLGQFTYSTSILPCLVWTILQDWVSPLMFILIKFPTPNMFALKVTKKHKYYKRGKGMILYSEGIV